MLLSDNYQAGVIEAFYSTSRYLDDLLNIDNPYFEQIVDQIYSTELRLHKANFLLDLVLFISFIENV